MTARPKKLPVLESVKLADLKPHPRNYRGHPEDQIEEIIASIEAHGFYRNIVIAKDDTILAGHGLVAAAIKMGKRVGPAIRLNLAPDDPRALQVLVSDNELSKRAESDDRALTELLRDLSQDDVGLFGTGYNEEQLAALAFVSRPASEIQDRSAAAEWVGMPGFEPEPEPLALMVRFRTEADRAEALDLLGPPPNARRTGATWSCWWPDRPPDDLKAVRFE